MSCTQNIFGYNTLRHDKKNHVIPKYKCISHFCKLWTGNFFGLKVLSDDGNNMPLFSFVEQIGTTPNFEFSNTDTVHLFVISLCLKVELNAFKT